MGFLTADFMLNNKTGSELYHKYAADMPIIDYHCHLPPEQIAEDHRFRSATQLFLGGDHYKWRQMRSNGIPEELITGNGDDWDKFYAWAQTAPYLIGNPLYHWNQLELARYFDINEGLTPANARAVYDAVNEKLALPEFSARNLVKNSNVEALCTTDDPASDLAAHDQVRDEGFSVKVLPTFRPDQSLNITAPGFIPYLEKAGVHNWQQLTKWLDSRMDYFALRGCRLSDHSLSRVPYGRGDAAAVLEKRLNGGELTDGEVQLYQTELMKVLAAGYSKRGWVMQLHIGALRNNNTAMFNKIGPDTGFDSMDDMPIAANLSALLNCMAMEGCLPKTVLYGLNPAYNSVLASMAGNFQSGPEAGRIQYGAAWWFNDHRDGMEEQLRTLGNLGILGRFVGMLTDSRSFVSYPRHEYFRRILCNLLGQWVERGEYPNDPAALEMLVKGICHDNAQRYFGF